MIEKVGKAKWERYNELYDKLHDERYNELHDKLHDERYNELHDELQNETGRLCADRIAETAAETSTVYPAN